MDFRRDVLPVLSSKCFACHGPDESARKAKLRLDVRDEALADHKGRRAIVPGKPSQSELVRRISTKAPDDIMPPLKGGHPLSKDEIATLRKWIEAGAPYDPHWSFVKPQLPALPKVRDTRWPQNAIDHFVLARLEREGFKPALPADPHTLIRRLSLDLTGLPPTPEEVEDFVRESQSAIGNRQLAIGNAVDRLLASPAFGERMARPWLDLARYADSAGYGSDPLRLNIWPWRDWVINAFNRNLPYDRFTLEQLAGDLLPNATTEQQVATGFHRNTMTNTEGGTDDEEFRSAAVKDRIAVTMQVWMGLTMNCAQCHSHKYDPISNREYYQFYAMFNQTEDNDKPDEAPTLPLPTPDEKARMEKFKAQVADLDKKLATPTPALLKELADWNAKQSDSMWTVLEPAEFASANGATLTKLADHSLLASGKSPDIDTYTVRVPTQLKAITALRLELLPDPSLPAKGAGRDEKGRAVVSSFKLATQPLKPESKKARFIRVELPGEHRVLSLAEVQVFSAKQNAALKGKATQSSTDAGADAARAIDGKTDGDFQAAKSTTATRTEDNPWWELDLGGELPVEEFVLWNRTDGGLGSRLANFKVFALDAARKEVFTQTVAAPPAPSQRFSFTGEKSVALANATSDFSQDGFEAAKAIDTDEKTGWSNGGKETNSLAAAFEVNATVGDTNGAMLVFTIAQAAGKQATLGRFRISATTQEKPVRVVPQKTRDLLAKEPAQRKPADEQELVKYYSDFAPSLAKARTDRDKAKKDLDAVKPVALPVMRELAKDKQRTTKVMVKGNFLSTADEVQPAFLSAFAPPSTNTPLSRLGVSQWLTSPDNPLTARVAVNRFWSQIFGTGLVETEEDFGTQGSRPSHPELLDWLAVTFSRRNSTEGNKGNEGVGSNPSFSSLPSVQEPSGLAWDMKALIKLIVTSATYQQSSLASPAAAQKDPRNRLLSHYPRARLDAETVRDQALALSGLLSRKVGGPSVYPPQPDGLWRAAFNGQRNWATSAGEDRYRRGLYTFWRRTVPYPSMATFDAPSRENCTVRRLPTNTPLQAFVTMNDPAYVEMSQALGRRLMQEGGATAADRARFGLQLALARPPTPAQVQSLVALYEKELAHHRENTDAAKKLATEPLGRLPDGLDAAEAAAWTVVANVLLNLDGVLTKG
jgi:hypothetical protein